MIWIETAAEVGRPAVPVRKEPVLPDYSGLAFWQGAPARADHIGAWIETRATPLV